MNYFITSVSPACQAVSVLQGELEAPFWGFRAPHARCPGPCSSRLPFPDLSLVLLVCSCFGADDFSSAHGGWAALTVSPVSPVASGSVPSLTPCFPLAGGPPDHGCDSWSW